MSQDQDHFRDADPSLLGLSAEILDAALILWDYHRLGHELVPADGILVFGSNDLRVADRAADLFHARLAPWILFSGARGRMTEDWSVTEAEALTRVARERGVPGDAILIENCATNTGENIRFSRELLAAEKIHLTTAIVVQKPYMERRSIAALEVQWPEVAFRASSPPLDFHHYCTADLPPRQVIEAMVGDFQRIIEYPALGFASPQATPADVLSAYRLLVNEGFSGRLR